MKNPTTVILLVAAAVLSTGAGIYFGIQNNNYITDWQNFLNNNKGLDLSMVKYLPKP